LVLRRRHQAKSHRDGERCFHRRLDHRRAACMNVIAT
jgi:hypothetical protein